MPSPLGHTPVESLKVLGDTATPLSLYPSASEPFPLSPLTDLLRVHICLDLPTSSSPFHFLCLYILVIWIQSRGFFAQLQLSLCPVKSIILCSVQQQDLHTGAKLASPAVYLQDGLFNQILETLLLSFFSSSCSAGTPYPSFFLSRYYFANLLIVFPP